MTKNEDKTYYKDLDGNIYDADSCDKKEQWSEHTWDDIQKDIAPPQPKKDEIIATEIIWRDSQLSVVLNRIDQYEKDQGYPVELRTSPLTAEQYNKLLQDRKLLSDYPSVKNFPLVERPVLLELV